MKMNLVTVADPFEMDCNLNQTVESLLAGEPNIADCAALIRQTQNSVAELFVYFIPQGPVNQPQLITRLKNELGHEWPVIRFAPLFKFPLTDDGLIDYQALVAIPVLDERCLSDAEKDLCRQPGIRNASIIRTQRDVDEENRYHLDNLIPDYRHMPAAEEPQAAPAESGESSAEQRQPAIVDGGELVECDLVEQSTILDLLRNAASGSRERKIRFVKADGQVSELRYRDLWDRAACVYKGLLDTGLAAGDKVVLQLHDNAAILAAFWGCQMGGFVPVIVEVPTSYQAGNQALERLLGLLQLLKNPLIIADESAASALKSLDTGSSGLELNICSIEMLSSSSPEHEYYAARPDDIAFFNLSSGSTGIPKCIMLTHRNLLSRAFGTNRLCGYSGDDVILNWLPFDHIGSISDWHLRCVMLGCDLIYVDKDYVLRQPVNWLNLIDRFRVTHSWAPNFAFTLIHQQLNQVDSAAWDLSCVKGLLTAGEAVSDSSVQGFTRALGKFGLKPMSVQPAFGMAELGSGITYFVPSEENPLRFHSVLKPAMGRHIERVAEEHPGATRFADLGPPIPGVTLRIVDHDGNVLPMETVGRLQIKGDVVFQGYFENPTANAASFAGDGWFNTGDLGFLSHGNLVLSGREKETIIIKGANYYSHEIEETATQVEGVESSFTAACGVRRIRDAEEKLAIFFVPGQTDREAELVRAIRTQIANRYGISPTYLIPLEKRQIPKTAIGKIQRTQLKQRLESGEFDAIVRRVDLLLGNANTLPNWFYRNVWTANRHLSHDPRLAEGVTLIMAGDCDFGDALAGQLEKNNLAPVLVSSGRQFACLNDEHYEINLNAKADHLKLFKHLQSKGIRIAQIVSLIDYQASAEISTDSCPRNIEVFLNTIQSVIETKVDEQLARIVWVARDCNGVTPAEPGLPEKAMMAGFTKSLRLEHPALECLHVDLSSTSSLKNAEILADELTGFCKEASVAYRHGKRYVARLEKLDLVNERQNPVELKPGGLYLVTGGLGGLGMELCRKLGNTYRAKLLIMGRSPLQNGENRSAVREESSNQLGQRFQTLLDEKIDCRYIQADVCDPAAVNELVAREEATAGRLLDGIFHLAGAAHERPLEQETVDGFVKIAGPKYQGTVVLGDLLKSRQGSFLAAFSSVNAFFGGASTACYSAANAFMDAYCRRLSRTGLPAYCYAWSLWDGMGMSAQSVARSAAAAKGFFPVSLEEGLNSLAAALQSGQPDMLIGLDARKTPIRIQTVDECYEMDSLAGFIEPKDAESAARLPQSFPFQDRFGAESSCRLVPIDALPLTDEGTVDKSRLQTLLVQDGQAKKKPANSVEAKLVELWRELLHVSDIGTQDNFFELGGDSLLVVQLVASIEKSFNQKIPASTLFHAPTVEKLAEVLDQELETPDLFSLVPIKSQGSRAPLFIIQSDSWEFVRYLDREQPVYGLNFGVGSNNAESMLNLPDRLEDLATHFVDEIQQVQPDGSYFLLGHSNAGLLAYEMAQQLVAQNKTVGFLGLIDTWYINDTDAEHAGKRRKLEKLLNFAKLPLTLQANIIHHAIKYRLRKLKLRYFTNEIEVPFLYRAMHLYKNYEPKPYPGKILYFKCIKQSRVEPVGSHEQKWEELALEGVSLHKLDCFHNEILMDPHVKLLADQIALYLK